MRACLRTLLPVLLLLPVQGCVSPGGKAEMSPLAPPGKYSCNSAEGRSGMVVSVSVPASDVGRSVLMRGGNAVDAAVATAFALAVTYPPAGNLGGGGFMLVHPAPGEGDPVAFIYRETAPAAAKPGMYTKEDSQYTHKAVATPGTVRGLALVHRRFGTLPWAQLIAPAVALARDGFLIDTNLADSLNETLPKATDAPEFLRVFGKPGGGPWKPGDRLVQPDLARTLQLLADLGPDAFYTGPIADSLVDEMARGKGLITHRDLADYQPLACKPLTTRYRGTYDVYVPPPPSAGGACLLEELNIVQCFDLKAWDRWSPQLMHVMAEAMRRAQYDRARYLGDPAFVEIPSRLTTPEYGRQLAQSIDLHKAGRSEPLPAGGPSSREEQSTTHFSIIDHKGMAVANTYTLERLWGTRIVVKNRGFLLNNNMFGFNLFPGETDTFGVANTIAPGKRMLSSQAPTIVAEGGRVKLVTGTPGTRAIPNTVLCLMVNLIDFEMPLRAAVEAPRFSHEWLPDQISFEAPERYPDLVKAMTAMGHTIVRTGPRPQGDAQTIWVVEPGRYVGAADVRRSKNSSAAGY